ncbi:MAG: NADH-quinone oxidoreductase subunit J [Chloroflexi bacterium]|nr:NADH-quinone oxidoreductase subunit J [Chloroflexota bacterium]MXY80270.1 NADH-quinone oxidoreductase subunit J [Chloroflexota bacterium]
MSDVGFHLAFWSLSALTIGGALMIIVSRNLIHAVIFLILSFIGVAGLFITLSADFLALVQILVYVGAIAVLMLFAILLTPRAARDNEESLMRYPAMILMGLVIAAGVFVALETDWGPMREGAIGTQAKIIGESLINQYVLPFEIGAVMLTAALVGAIALARQDDEDLPIHTASLIEEGVLPPPDGDAADAPAGPGDDS